jgi:hypothetical protein
MSHNTRKPIVLSVKDKNLDPAQNTQFLTASFDVTDLKDVFLNKNYSAISWRGSRSKEHFDFATGFIPDFDKGSTIQDAETCLKNAKLNYALITSKSHKPAAHRFHTLIPFTRKIYTVENYEKVTEDIRKNLFPTLDPAVMDAADFLFGSPASAFYSDYWAGKEYDPDDGLNGQVPNAWNDRMIVKTADGKQIVVSLLKQKTPIYCPFHDDQSASAFFGMSNSDGKPFIHCSACNKTFWRVEIPIEERCKHYWSYEKEVYQFGIKGGRFYMSKIGKTKFDVFMNTRTNKEEDEAFRYLLAFKHIAHVNLVKHMADMSAKATTYTVDDDEGDVIVKYAPIAAKINDNQFIEDYLERTFGAHKQFIKEYMATYCYSDYRDLPTLVLKGARGSGKNTFAEMVYTIFPAISTMWEAKKNNFTDEAEKKLLIADETVSDSEEVYRLIKQYSGSKHARVNKKYVIPYDVENNMNIIILSNSAMPLYVASYEQPTSPEDNQFFVYDFKPFQGKIDPELGQKLEDRIGHYVRTELKAVYDKIDFTGNRYSIKVPITLE